MDFNFAPLFLFSATVGLFILRRYHLKISQKFQNVKLLNHIEKKSDNKTETLPEVNSRKIDPFPTEIDLMESSKTNLSTCSLIPKPFFILDGDGVFQINSKTKVIFLLNSFCDLVPSPETNFLLNCIKKSSGLGLEFLTSSSPEDYVLKLKNVIILSVGSFDQKQDSYSISISPDSLRICSNSLRGIFYSIQTFNQLLNDSNSKLTIPCGEIQDYSIFRYRGIMIDVARHFFSVEDIKFIIDLSCNYKLNYLHIHLSDDQGWRIQIDSYPLLCQIGSRSSVGGGKGGFFTKDQYRHIVHYAQERHVTVVPEIDMPSHINAALSSYGFLNKNSRKNMPSSPVLRVDRTALDPPALPDPDACDLYVGMKVGFSLLDFNEPLIYMFLESVLSEIVEMTPGPYLHIGGDEPTSIAKSDYDTFMTRVIEIVVQKGKTVIGWQEISSVPSPRIDQVVSQFWYSKGEISSDASGFRPRGLVILSPSSRTYLDMKYSPTDSLGLSWSGYIELSDAYGWSPASFFPPNIVAPHNILGVEAPLWTETILTRRDLEYMLLPRLAAIAELAWGVDPATKNYNEFLRRISSHAKRWWTTEGWNYHRSPGL